MYDVDPKKLFAFQTVNELEDANDIVLDNGDEEDHDEIQDDDADDTGGYKSNAEEEDLVEPEEVGTEHVEVEETEELPEPEVEGEDNLDDIEVDNEEPGDASLEDVLDDEEQVELVSDAEEEYQQKELPPDDEVLDNVDVEAADQDEAEIDAETSDQEVQKQ